MLRVLAFFLLGMVLMRAGFFEPHRRAWHARACVLGLAIGLPGEVLVAAGWMVSDFHPTAVSAAGESLHALTSAALCLGYAGTILLLVYSGALRLLMAALAAVGRMALSNYILQTIVCTWISYWWGLALFGELSREQMVLLAVAIFAAQLVLSPIWLSVFTMGPLEWMWRTLTYGRRQPLLRRR
jgi:uncharacterized protein